MEAVSTSKPLSQPKSLKGINHVKLPVFSLKRTLEFYTTVFPFIHLPELDHFTPDHKLFAQLFRHEPSRLLVELRYVPSRAEAQRGWDPVSWGVGTRKDLEEWAEWLDAHNVKHSPILKGLQSWMMACEDPDGKIIRFYVEDEEHEWTENPDKDENWLPKIETDPNV